MSSLEELEAALRVAQRRAAEQRVKLKHQLDHMPRTLDTVNDMSFTASRAPNMKGAKRIHKWDDGDGNIVYTVNMLANPSSFPSLSEVKALSTRINKQRTAFDQLDPAEQSRLSSVFDSSKGTAPDTQPYLDHLQSAALGRRFEHLKQNPPKPFSR